MGLLDRILSVFGGGDRAPSGPPSPPGPQRLLNSLYRDYEDASAALGARFDKVYPAKAQAMLRSPFDKNRDYDGERAAGQQALSDALSDTWEMGLPYQAWVDNAARRVRI